MTDKSPPPQPPSSHDETETAAPAGASGAGPSSANTECAGTTERKSKKKTRLMWDEENLQLNALEMERHPKMKIDEPKTPFERGPGSEAGSSTSGSAPGSPAPYFIPKERLRGFDALEASAVSGNSNNNNININNGGEVGNSLRRSVQIVDERNPAADGSPSASNDEFIAKRRKHYANEARLMVAECEEDRENSAEPLGASVYNPPAPEPIDINNNMTTNHDNDTDNIRTGNGTRDGDDVSDDGVLPNGHGHNHTVPNGTS